MGKILSTLKLLGTLLGALLATLAGTQVLVPTNRTSPISQTVVINPQVTTSQTANPQVTTSQTANPQVTTSQTANPQVTTSPPGCANPADPKSFCYNAPPDQSHGVDGLNGESIDPRDRGSYGAPSGPTIEGLNGIKVH